MSVAWVGAKRIFSWNASATTLRLLIRGPTYHDTVNHQLAEAVEFFLCATNGLTQVLELVVHEQNPAQVKAVLLGHTAVVVGHGRRGVFFNQSRVGDSLVIGVMNQGRKGARELRQWVRRDTVRMVVQGIVIVMIFELCGCNDSPHEFCNRHEDMT